MSEHIFWQYPVVTEKTFNEQAHAQNVKNYVGFPWATAIDKKMNLNYLEMVLGPKINKDNFNITCCQHIFFRRLIRLFRVIGIKMLYTPHKVYGEDQIEGIIIKPCPLFAVNVEDESRNSTFKNVDFLNINRKYLYTFKGALQTGYLTDIRDRIFKLPKKSDIRIEHIGEWHFNETVYSKHQTHEGKSFPTDKHKTNHLDYNELLLQSTFSLCPSGTGPNSIRFWESLAVGAIPVILADTLELPEHPLWKKAIIRIPEAKVELMDKYLRSFTAKQIKERVKYCIEIYKYFRDNYRNTQYDPYLNTTQIVHYGRESYETKQYGYEAAYDFQLKCLVPNRRFFKATEHKDKMLSFLRSCAKPPLIFTDLNLASDIPNDYFAIMVQHTTSLDIKALESRDPTKSHIITLSKYGKEQHVNEIKYKKFKNTKILLAPTLNVSTPKQYEYDLQPGKKVSILSDRACDIEAFIQSDLCKTFVFKQLQVNASSFKSLKTYNDARSLEFIKCDIFLQLSTTENYNGYSTLDAAACGLAIVSTPIGLFAEIPTDCYVRIEIDQMYNTEYMRDKLMYAWQNRVTLGNKVKEFVQTNCTTEVWTKQMKALTEQVVS